MNQQPLRCPCQVDAIPCESCADAMEAEWTWMKPLAKRNVESKRAGLGPIAAGLVYDYPEELDWQFNELKEQDR